MAYIEQRKGGWLVVWRDADTGKKQSQLCGFFDPDDVEDRARTRDRAEALRARMASTERATKRVIARRDAAVARIDPRWALATDMVEPDEDQLRFENYVAGLIDGGDLTESARHTYQHTLRNHIAGTPLGRKNVRFIDETDVESFWRALKIGDGAKRNIAQVLRKGFTRAVKRGLMDVSPMTRADISVPSKKRRVRGVIVPLEVEDLKKLAAAASSERDRLIVRVMGFGGLRAGEVGGLTRSDVVRRTGYCELNLHQQVVRVGRKKMITGLKTDAAQRSVPIPCSLADQLEAFCATSPPARDGRIFHGTDDGLVAAQGINNAVQRTAKRAGLGPVHSHLLRHTAASLWFDDGIDAESVRRALGHSDIKITLGLYAHMMKGGAAKLAQSMERRLAG